jgi:hypothetical protein
VLINVVLGENELDWFINLTRNHYKNNGSKVSLELPTYSLDVLEASRKYGS